MGAPQELQIKIVRESGETPGVLPNVTGRVWRPHETPSPGHKPTPVPWEVVMTLPEELEPALLFFETRKFAKRWVASDPRGEGLDASSLEPPDERAASAVDDDALTRRFEQLAKECGVPPESEEAFELAHEREV